VLVDEERRGAGRLPDNQQATGMFTAARGDDDDDVKQSPGSMFTAGRPGDGQRRDSAGTPPSGGSRAGGLTTGLGGPTTSRSSTTTPTDGRDHRHAAQETRDAFDVSRSASSTNAANQRVEHVSRAQKNGTRYHRPSSKTVLGGPQELDDADGKTTVQFGDDASRKVSTVTTWTDAAATSASRSTTPSAVEEADFEVGSTLTATTSSNQPLQVIVFSQ